MTIAAAQLDRLIHQAIDDTPGLVDDYLWIQQEADWPPGVDRDRPTRVRLSDDDEPGLDDPDYVPGPTLALGVGNDQARAAYQRCETLTANAHRLAGTAVARLHEIRGRIPRRVRQPKRFGFEEVAWSTARRLQWLLDDGVCTVTDPEIRRLAHAAAIHVLEAHATLAGVLADVDRTKQPPLGSGLRCDNCHAPCGPDRKRIGRRDVECAACERGRLRLRARGIDGKRIPPHAKAHEAKKRRVARGEDHAASPLPHPGREAS